MKSIFTGLALIVIGFPAWGQLNYRPQMPKIPEFRMPPIKKWESCPSPASITIQTGRNGERIIAGFDPGYQIVEYLVNSRFTAQDLPDLQFNTVWILPD